MSHEADGTERRGDAETEGRGDAENQQSGPCVPASPRPSVSSAPTPDARIEASRTRSAYLSHMRHELRTPLNAILGYSELLLEDAADRDEDAFKDELQRIHAAGARLLQLVNDLLDPARIQAAMSDVDLEQFGASIRHELRTPLNAVIGYTELLIEDTEDDDPDGPVAELQKILLAAKNLLALIDEIVHFSQVEAGQADVDVESSEFSSLIREVVTTVRPLAEDDGTAQGEHGALLVVDDNETNRDLLSRRLARQGYTVAVAEDGRQALERIRAQKFDLVLLDMMMPGLNGYQVLQSMKGDETLRHIPVIMVSALDEIDSVVRCIEMGAEDYLTKPFNPVLLQARIGASLEKKRLRDREARYLRQIEEEKRRSDELLHVILPAEIVAELKATNAVKPRRYEHVAVLFCDIVEFTPYCEQRQPEEVLAHLQELIQAYEELALRHGLQKIKTSGDEFMATAGLLQPVENPVLNCVRCGLEMLPIARRLPARWNVRVGIHVGPVMAGVVGHRQYLFDLLGDTVNTAKRVESHAPHGSVTVSDRAWAEIAPHCRGESLGRVPVKGKGEMELFRVSELKAA